MVVFTPSLIVGPPSGRNKPVKACFSGAVPIDPARAGRAPEGQAPCFFGESSENGKKISTRAFWSQQAKPIVGVILTKPGINPTLCG